MQHDVVGLRDFYSRPLGGIVRRLLTQRIRARWRNARGRELVGLGFAVPYIGMFRDEAAHLAALMPAHQGALVWPQTGSVLSVLVDEVQLPLPDAAVDLLLCVHCLEVAEATRPMLREMWRVLAPEGRLLLIVPNRRGLWARFDTTPFGHGRPYSRGQLEKLLADAMFTPTEWTSALYMPPLNRYWAVRWATVFERMGARLWPGFAGVIIVEARKELMGAVPKKAPAKSKLKPVPAATQSSSLSPRNADLAKTEVGQAKRRPNTPSR
jgi:SAM-dependent methyltransferase